MKIGYARVSTLEQNLDMQLRAWFARIVVAAAVIDALDSLDLKYPKADDRKLKELAAAKRDLQVGK